MSRVTIELARRDRELLEQMTLEEYRSIGQQAAYLLSLTLRESIHRPLDCAAESDRPQMTPTKEQANNG